jgi:hypothetical protein
MGFDRGDLIRQFAHRAGSAIYETDDATGLMRAGRKARQIGPLYADNDPAAVALLEHIVEDKSGSLVIDLAAAHSGAREFLLSRGFVFERPFTRMRFGEGAPRSAGDSAKLIAVAGPEFG